MQKLCLCLFHLTHEINERALGCLAFHTHENGREFQALTTFARAAMSAASLLSPSGRRAAPATATVRATCSGLRPDTLHTCSSGPQASSTKSRLGQPEQPVPSSDLGTHHCGSKESMMPSYLAGGRWWRSAVVSAATLRGGQAACGADAALASASGTVASIVGRAGLQQGLAGWQPRPHA